MMLLILKKYCPVVEDISMEDEVLCQAVQQIESKYAIFMSFA